MHGARQDVLHYPKAIYRMPRRPGLRTLVTARGPWGVAHCRTGAGSTVHVPAPI